MTRYYTYQLRDPRNQAIRYIGQSIDPWKRHKQHCSTAMTKNRRKTEWVRELASQGMQPVLEVCCDFPTRESCDIRERLMIKNQIMLDSDLLNIADGGMGGPVTPAKHIRPSQWQEMADKYLLLKQTISELTTLIIPNLPKHNCKRMATLQTAAYALRLLIEDAMIDAEMGEADIKDYFREIQ